MKHKTHKDSYQAKIETLRRKQIRAGKVTTPQQFNAEKLQQEFRSQDPLKRVSK